jgi:hypothetical protein
MDVTRRTLLSIVAGTSFVPIGEVAARVVDAVAPPSAPIPPSIAELEREFHRCRAAAALFRTERGYDDAADEGCKPLYDRMFNALVDIQTTPPACLSDVLIKLRWLADPDWGFEATMQGEGDETLSVRQCIAWLSGTPMEAQS